LKFNRDIARNMWVTESMPEPPSLVGLVSNIPQMVELAQYLNGCEWQIPHYRGSTQRKTVATFYIEAACQCIGLLSTTSNEQIEDIATSHTAWVAPSTPPDLELMFFASPCEWVKISP
jgi:hypothetical protein